MKKTSHHVLDHTLQPKILKVKNEESSYSKQKKRHAKFLEFMSDVFYKY